MQSVPSQLAAIEGKIELVGEEGEKSGWRRSEEGFLPLLLAFLLLGVFWRRRGWRKAINLRFVISHFPLSLPRQSRPPIPHLLDGRGEEPTMERESPLQEGILGLQCVANRTGECWLADCMPKIRSWIFLYLI